MRRNPNAQIAEDQLPPHSEEAELGVLGCVLFDIARADAALTQVRERFGITQPFYTPNHEIVFRAMCGLQDEGVGVDVITLIERLRSTGRLQEAGGAVFVSTLADKTPSAANLDHYLDIVWSKYVARVGSQTLRKVADQFHTAGVSQTLLADLVKRVEDLQKAAAPPNSAALLPPHVRTVDEFHDKVWNCFFGSEKGEPGVEMPFPFPMKIRRGELTFMVGEKGAGKSTIQSWILLNMLQAGFKGFVASMEMRPEHTLKMLVQQLLGQRDFEDCTQHHKKVRDAIAWLTQRVIIYDFLGIADWRQILDAAQFATQFLGSDFFLIDSVMRLGISDDDFAQQGDCAKSFANFCTSRDVHMILTNHLNKSEGGVQKRSRGSAQWIDNSHNVIKVELNAEKGTKLSDLWNDRCNSDAAFDSEARQHADNPSRLEEIAMRRTAAAVGFNEALAKLRAKWDSHLVLHHQRYPGSRQNGSTFLWFDSASLQFRGKPDELKARNLLEEWKTKDKII